MDTVEKTVGKERGRSERYTRFGWIITIAYLFFLIYPIRDLLLLSDLRLSDLLLSLATLAAFVAVYLWSMLFRPFGEIASYSRASRADVSRVTLLCAMSLGLVIVHGAEWLGLFIYVSVAAGTRLPTAVAFRAILGLTALVAFLGWLLGLDSLNLWQLVILTGAVGLSMVGWVRMVATVRELRAAQEEIARLAVNEERLRFARDLHDLLGHSLSLIALKTDVISRLLPDSPERAAAEARDAEVVAREALREVRTAVTGYRRPTLLAELAAAREVLGAAGIGYSVEGEEVRPPAPAEEVLAWAVREGITNVVRHSRARRCAIRLELVGDEAFLDVVDDGVGALPVGPDADGAGSGLAGLRERAAAAGGTLETGTGPGGGFRLRVSVPVSGERADDAGNDGPGGGSAPSRSTTGGLLA